MDNKDKTIFEEEETVFDPDETVLEAGATVREGEMTLPDATLSDAASQAKPADPAENTTIEKGSLLLETYSVESDAMEGGMGSVWRVHHRGWDTDLAMKRPQPEFFSTEESKANFTHECEAWIGLGLHPNIVSCHYVREIGGVPSIFSEWMDGGSLEDAIKRGTLYEGTEEEQKERLLDIAIQFARGLQYAHEAKPRGLIHQDVKPDNLLLTAEGEAKVADFGLARARITLSTSVGNPVSRDGPEAGETIFSPSGGYTPAYCSAEQMEQKPLTRRTDIYSWAVSVMEMYIGSRPWMNGVVAGLSCREYMEETRVHLSEPLKELLVECMAKDPEDRPHDFAVVIAKLLKIYEAETGGAYPRPDPRSAADTAGSLNNRAMSFLDLGKPEEAERLWAQAYEMNRDHDDVNVNRALFSWRSGKIDDLEMKEALSPALNDPPFAEALARECGEIIETNTLLFNKKVNSSLGSEDGRKAVIRGLRLSPQVIALPSLEVLYSLNAEEMLIGNVAFSPDGKRIYANCSSETDDESFFFIFDSASGETILRTPNPPDAKGYGGYLRVTPDGTKVVCYNRETNVFFIRDARTGRVESRHAVPALGERSKRGFVLLPGGSQAIVTGFVDAFRVDLERGEVVTIYKVEETVKDEKEAQSKYHGYLNALAVDPTGRLLLTGDMDGQIWLWDVESGQRLKRLYKHKSNVWINGLCFCSGGKRFVSADRDGVIRFHDFPDGGHIITHAVRAEGLTKNWILGVSLLPTADPDTVVVVDDASNLLTIKASPIGETTPLRLSRVSGFEQTLSDESTYRSAMAAAEEALSNRQIEDALSAVEEAYGCEYRDEEELSALNRRIGRFCRRKRIRSAQVVKLLELSSRNTNSFASSVDVAVRDGSSFAYATGIHSQSGIFEIDLKSMEARDFCRTRWHDPNRKIQGTHISPAGRFLTVVTDEKVNLYDLTEKSDTDAYQTQLQDNSSGALSSGWFAACCDDDGNVLGFGRNGACIITRQSGYRERFLLDKKTHSIPHERGALFSPDGLTAYLLTSGYLLQFRLDGSDAAQTLWEGFANCVTLSYDGTLAALGDYNGHEDRGHVVVIRTKDGSEVCRFAIDGAGVNDLAFGPEGKTLYCALQNGTVNIYDLSDPEPKPIWQLSRGQHNNYLRSVAVTADARYVLTGEQGGSLCIWELNWEYDFPGFSEWDQDAQTCLEKAFLRHPGKTASDLEAVLTELQNRGFGHLDPERARAELTTLRGRKRILPKLQLPKTPDPPKSKPDKAPESRQPAPETPPEKKKGKSKGFWLFKKKK